MDGQIDRREFISGLGVTAGTAVLASSAIDVAAPSPAAAQGRRRAASPTPRSSSVT